MIDNDSNQKTILVESPTELSKSHLEPIRRDHLFASSMLLPEEEKDHDYDYGHYIFLYPENNERAKVAIKSYLEFVLLDAMHHGSKTIAPEYRSRLQDLSNLKIVEVVGKGRGTRYILSRQIYQFIGKSGVYTRKRGLDRDTNKELLLKHLRDNQKEGSQLHDLVQVLPSLSENQVKTLLREMKKDNRVVSSGQGRGGRRFIAQKDTLVIGSESKKNPINTQLRIISIYITIYYEQGYSRIFRFYLVPIIYTAYANRTLLLVDGCISNQ